MEKKTYNEKKQQIPFTTTLSNPNGKYLINIAYMLVNREAMPPS